MLYKVTFKPKSSFITQLTSTTLFGALCCAMHDMPEYGDDTLEKVVFTDADSLVVSNAFPLNCISDKYYRHNNQNYVMSTEDGSSRLFTFEGTKYNHCMVDRDTIQSVNHWQNISYSTKEMLNIYVYSTVFSLEDIQKIVSTAFLNGIGARRSTGHGQFELIDISEVEDILLPDLRAKQTGNIGYLVISDYIPDTDDTTLGSYSARIFNGKTIHGKEKKPLVVLNAGSTFKGDLGSNVSTIGKLVHDESTNTYTSGRAIAVRVSVD